MTDSNYVPFTLDDIRAAAEKEFGALEITFEPGSTVKLRNPMRCSSDDRAEFQRLQKSLKGKRTEDGDADQADVNEEDAEAQIDVLRKILLLVADNKQLGARLVNELGDDLGLVAATFNAYGKKVKAGEA